jgi:hypothetical protein
LHACRTTPTTVTPMEIGAHAELKARCSQLSMGSGLRRNDGI